MNDSKYEPRPGKKLKLEASQKGAEEMKLTVSCSKTGTLTVGVFDTNGNGLEDATVIVHNAAQIEQQPSQVQDNRTTFVLPPGAYTRRVIKDGYLASRFATDVVEGAEVAEHVVLQRPAVLEVTITNPHGAAVTDAVLLLVWDLDDFEYEIVPHTVGGVYRLADLRPGACTVTIQCDRYRKHDDEPVQLTEGQTSALNVALAGADLVVRVRDKDSKALKTAAVTATVSANDVQLTNTDADAATFTFAGVPAGPARIIASANEFATAEFNCTIDAGVHQTFDMTLLRTPGFYVMVVDSADHLIAGAALQAKAFNHVPAVVSRGDGVFFIQQTQNWLHDLKATANGYCESTLSQHPRAGIGYVTIKLKRLATLQNLRVAILDAAQQGETAVNTDHGPSNEWSNDWCWKKKNEKQTNAMWLGELKHARAETVLRTWLNQYCLQDYDCGIEQSYRCDKNKKTEFLGDTRGQNTARPDIVIYPKAKPLKVKYVLDFKFSCPPGKNPQWGNCTHPDYVGKTQGEFYSIVLGGPTCILVSPGQDLQDL